MKVSFFKLVSVALSSHLLLAISGSAEDSNNKRLAPQEDNVVGSVLDGNRSDDVAKSGSIKGKLHLELSMTRNIFLNNLILIIISGSQIITMVPKMTHPER